MACITLQNVHHCILFTLEQSSVLHKGKGVKNSQQFVLFKSSETLKICILHNGFCVRETRFLACGCNMDRGFVSLERCEGV